MKTDIRYKCSCMQDEVTFSVTARRKHQDIKDWMENYVTPQLTKDHAKRSPLCRSTTVEYLKLPVPEDGRAIGEPKEKLN